MMPYLWDDLGGSVVGFGIMMSEFGALQLLGNLLSGEPHRREWTLPLTRSATKSPSPVYDMQRADSVGGAVFPSKLCSCSAWF